ncbi:MAG TPA: YtxH domain-containing protein [Chitinophagaceae bacterium]|nr:YtxH domain-containing protein [Chitinophagaceae bacterium]
MSIKAFTNGLIAGFILGVLFAPDNGSETRRRIAKKASDVKDAACNTYNNIAETVGRQYDRIKSKANDFMEEGDELYVEVKSDVQQDAANMFE